VRAQSKAERAVSSTVSKQHSQRNGKRGDSPLLLSAPIEKAGRSLLLGSAERSKADHTTRPPRARALLQVLPLRSNT